MPKNSLVPAANSSMGLLKQTDREKILIKLRDYKIKDLEAKRKKELPNKLRWAEKVYADAFVKLCKKMLQLTPKRLRSLTRKELKIVEELIARKATFWALAQSASFLTILPLLVYSLDSAGRNTNRKHNIIPARDIMLSLRFLLARRTIKKIAGSDYFPYEACRYDANTYLKMS